MDDVLLGVMGYREDSYWWCLIHDAADSECGVFGSHYVIPLNHAGPPTKEERRAVLREMRENAHG